MLHTLEVAYGPQTAVVWLNRPHCGNALNGQAISELVQVFDGLAADPDVLAIVLAGHGSSFCAGLDMTWLPGASQQDLEQAGALLMALRQCTKPVIARVQGMCAGIGMALAAAATLTVAARDSQFSHTGVRMGISPELSAPHIAAAIGARAARRWLLTGDVMDAPEAWRLGLVHELCELDELDPRVNAMLGSLLRAAPSARQAAMNLLHSDGAATDPPSQALKLGVSLAGQDALAGLAAAREGRQPPWVERLLQGQHPDQQEGKDAG